ncbi:MAG: zinc ribbon domain-containing protein [Eubacteriales bacterium]|nr:zinc ribbon domain-containing protein [Eubacteriales bacterium]
MFCRNCGKKLDDSWNVCPYCKSVIREVKEPHSRQQFTHERPTENEGFYRESKNVRRRRTSATGKRNVRKKNMVVPIVGAVIFVVLLAVCAAAFVGSRRKAYETDNHQTDSLQEVSKTDNYQADSSKEVRSEAVKETESAQPEIVFVGSSGTYIAGTDANSGMLNIEKTGPETISFSISVNGLGLISGEAWLADDYTAVYDEYDFFTFSFVWSNSGTVTVCRSGESTGDGMIDNCTEDITYWWVY